MKGCGSMRERPYAITIMDKQGRVYFLTEELNSGTWKKRGDFSNAKSEYSYYFRKRTEDICLHNIKLFQTEQLARDFWKSYFENSKATIDNLYRYYNLDTLAICKVVMLKKDEVLM